MPPSSQVMCPHGTSIQVSAVSMGGLSLPDANPPRGAQDVPLPGKHRGTPGTASSWLAGSLLVPSRWLAEPPRRHIPAPWLQPPHGHVIHQ